MDHTLLILLVTVAGPIIGSFIGVIKKPSLSTIHFMMSFSAGIMLAISFLELLPLSLDLADFWIVLFGFFCGALLMLMLDKLIPHAHPEVCDTKKDCSLHRTAIYLIVGIFLHNFPEGMAIALGDGSFGLVIAIAIAVHNVPEGICTSAPYYFCTKKRLKAFLVSSSTAIPLLVGYVVAKFLFANISADATGFITAATAGLMVFIVADELIPNSCKKHQQGWSHLTIFALIIGIMFVMFLGHIF